MPGAGTAGASAAHKINPNPAPERVALGTTRTYTVTGFDADNNPVVVNDPVWSVTKALGTISSTGTFSPSSVGKGSLSVASGSIKTDIGLETYKRPSVVLGPISSTTKNSTSNSNANSNANTNTPTNVNANTNTNSQAAAPAATTCSARRNWVWGLILLAILGGTALLYAFVSVTKIWPAAIVLIVAASAAILEHRYGCGNTWWSWIAILGAAGLTAFAYQQSPKDQV